MPNPTPANAGVEQLVVEQIDRDAAAAIYHHFRDHDFATWIMKGENAGGDNNSVIQLLARHRLAALRHQPARTDEVERVVAWLEGQAGAGEQACASAMPDSKLERDLSAGVVTLRRAIARIKAGDHLHTDKEKG